MQCYTLPIIFFEVKPVLKKRPTKSEIRQSLDQQVEDFLSSGGEVNAVDNGVSGDNQFNPWQTPLFLKGTQQDHTPITHLYKVIDGRKRKQTQSSAKKQNRKPTKELIYDDFGEPLRWVWKE